MRTRRIPRQSNLGRQGHPPRMLLFWTCMFVLGVFFSKYHRSPEENPENVLTRTVIVLDESGSMHLDRPKVIHALNDFITAQQAEGLDCRVTLMKFNDRVKTVLDDIQLSELRKITESDYQPNGGTALFDAIGTAIRKFSEEKDILLVVITDGEENSSREFSQTQVKKLIDLYTSPEYRWNVQYLAAEPSLQEQGERVGIPDSPEAGLTNSAYEFTHLPELLSQRSTAFHKKAQARQ